MFNLYYLERAHIFKTNKKHSPKAKHLEIQKPQEAQ